MRKLSIALASLLMLSASLAHAESTHKFASATEYRDAVFLTCMQSVPEKVGKDYTPAINKCLASADKKAKTMLERKAKREAAALVRAEKAQAKQAAKVAKCMTDTECESTDKKG